MKWNDAYLANSDCDGDGKLDEHFGYDTYLGSGALVTNRMSGTDARDGRTCRWNHFVKIVAAPADAKNGGELWVNANGTPVGPAWKYPFVFIHRVVNDPCAGDHGIVFQSPDHAGLGGW